METCGAVSKLERETGSSMPQRLSGGCGQRDNSRHLHFSSQPPTVASRRLSGGRPVLLQQLLQELANAPLPRGDRPHAHRVPHHTAAFSCGKSDRQPRRRPGGGVERCTPLSPLLAVGDGPALRLLNPSAFRGARAAGTAGRAERGTAPARCGEPG